MGIGASARSRSDFGQRSRRYVLAALTILSAFSHLDRQLLAIVLEPIRTEFSLSDVQLGLLSGLAFAALYTTLSIPAAMTVMHGGRARLISLSAAFWGVMTVSTGFAQSFAQLLLTRLGVGVGEAGFLPAAHAMVSSLYKPGERATALATLSAGVNVGVFFAFLIGGVIAQAYGWRAAFLTAGVGTLLFTIVFWLTVPEPPLNADEAVPVRSGGQALRDSFRPIYRDPVLLHLVIGTLLTSIVSYAALSWLPSLLVRAHGLSLTAVGIYLALVVGLGGALGTWLGGYASDRLARRDRRWSLWFMALGYTVTKPLAIGFFLAGSTPLALALFVLPGMTGALFTGPAIATLHDRVAPELRPVASAIVLFLTTFIGLGLGPLIAGALSDYVFAGAGDRSLNYALLVLQIVGLWGALHFWIAGQKLGRARLA